MGRPQRMGPAPAADRRNGRCRTPSIPAWCSTRPTPWSRGHIGLMQACTQEDIPAETGWLPHEGLWTYNAAFVAHVYLWAGLPDWARRTFHGFLNHASPLYCWREEQPLPRIGVGRLTSATCRTTGPAPKCILLPPPHAGARRRQDRCACSQVSAMPTSPAAKPSLCMALHSLRPSDLTLEPSGAGWRLRYERGRGPAPQSVELPQSLGARLQFTGVSGAHSKSNAGKVQIDPQSSAWTATWNG